MNDTDFSARLAPLRKFLPPVGSWQAVLWAMGFLSLGALVRLPFDAAVNARLPPFLTVYPAVVLASFAGGLRVGAATAVVGGFLSWALWLAPYGYEIPSYGAISLAAYAVAVGITVAGSGIARLLLDECVAIETQRAVQAKETVHRIKNLIAVVQALSNKIASETDDKDVYAGRLNRRLAALARAQDILIQTDWRPTDLKTVVDSALEPFLANPRLQVRQGPAATTPARLVSGLSMALYELAANAVKHGPLAGDAGLIALSWRKEAGRCKVEWRETGIVPHKIEEGLGFTLIRGAMSAEKDAHVSYAMGADSLTCVFDWPEQTP
ncbi:MAG TPA: HWE histidine kinase domain-containing protein [Caulobacterales bacterium]|nr:HWE histidine kinase domain-containing protein [Caulobacterales bacterium]